MADNMDAQAAKRRLMLASHGIEALGTQSPRRTSTSRSSTPKSSCSNSTAGTPGPASHAATAATPATPATATTATTATSLARHLADTPLQQQQQEHAGVPADKASKPPLRASSASCSENSAPAHATRMHTPTPAQGDFTSTPVSSPPASSAKKSRPVSGSSKLPASAANAASPYKSKAEASGEPCGVASLLAVALMWCCGVVMWLCGVVVLLDACCHVSTAHGR